MKILFLSANPPGSARLDLEKEVSKIEEGLQRSKLNGHFELVTKWAVDSNALRRALLEENPDVVHFSGHGEGQSGLVLVGQNGQAKPATGEALSGLFKQFPNIKCVLLNACYAEVQAQAIVQHIDYVIGMKQAVRDDAAIAFATGFYDGLGYAKSIDVAFELGRNAVQFELACFSGTTRKFIPVAEEVEPLPDHLIPVLLKKELSSADSTNSMRSSETSLVLQELWAEHNVTQADTNRFYRERVQEFLSDQTLSHIEKVQLAILAKVLGLSETEANRILQEEQNKQSNVPSAPTQPTLPQRSWSTSIGTAKKYFIAGAALLAVLAGGFWVHNRSTPNYPQLQTLLEKKDWKSADDETARILWEKAGRQKERSLRVEDFEKISCSDLVKIDTLWTQHSNKHFGFSIQKNIWLSNEVNSDLTKFVDRVGWGRLNPDGSFFYLHIDGQTFDLSTSAGKLPLATTYYGGNNETRKSYMARLNTCLP